jgi:hypothetical protein
MKSLILAAALVFVAGGAFAGELDNESSVTNQAMNGTVVVRVDTRTNKTSVMTSETAVSKGQEAQNLVATGSFQAVDSKHVKSELDQDGGASSWYFYNGYNNNYGCMNWYGNWYRPYYTYAYSYYYYYYYSNYYW